MAKSLISNFRQFMGKTDLTQDLFSNLYDVPACLFQNRETALAAEIGVEVKIVQA